MNIINIHATTLDEYAVFMISVKESPQISVKNLH